MRLTRIWQIAIILLAAVLLSSCVELKGELGINSAARLTGEITYKIDKSLASSAGISSLDDVNRESNKSSSQQEGPCENQKFIEDSKDYILRCSLANAISESGDITAQQIGKAVFFRFKNNLDAAPDSSRADFGTVSLTLRFADAVTSFKENKVGLLKKIDNFTFQISGYATEPMNIEIVANCDSRCGVSNSVSVPTQPLSPEEAAERAVDAANEATDAANRAADAATAAANRAAAAASKAAEDAQAKAEAARIIEDARAQASKILEDAKAVAKKRTITCVKGKLSKKVTAVQPKCPSGYKLKK